MTMCNALTSNTSIISTAVASMCQSSSVMSVNTVDVENCVFFGTPCGVSFFAFSRFFAFIFYYFGKAVSQFRTSQC